MNNFYEAFGLNIASDLELPELLPCDPGAKIDLHIHAGDTKPSSQATTQFSLQLPAVGSFQIENGDRIVYLRNDGVCDGDVRLFLLGSCFGCILQQRGYVVLHGNAVSTDGETCTILVGKQGAGKSTAAAWHYLNGAHVLADDVCAVTLDDAGDARVIPSFPRLKLWQTSADLLGIPTRDLERIREGFDKYSLPLGARFGTKSLRLTEIIEITPASGAEVSFHGMAKLRPLIEHSYRHHFLEPMKLNGAYTKKLFQLAGSVEVRSAPRMVLA